MSAKEPPAEEVTKVMNSLFSDTPVETSEKGERLVKPEDQISPAPQTPEPTPQASEEDDIPDTLISQEPPQPTDGQAPEDDTDGLLPLPGEDDDIITPAARKVIEKYAYESRELKRQLREAQESSGTPAEGEDLQSRIAELEEELGRMDLSRSPAFKNRYDVPIENLDKRALTLLTRSGVPEEDAQALLERMSSTNDLRQRELMFDELEADVSPSVVGTILQATVERDDLLQVRETALTDWKTSKAAVEEQAKQEKQARDTKAVKELLKSAVDSVRDENNPFFVTVEGNDEWNTGVVEHYQNALTDVLRRNDPSEVSKLVAHGLTFSELLRRYANERQRRQTLERTLSQDTPASPAPGRPTEPVRRAKPDERPKNTREVLDRLF